MKIMSWFLFVAATILAPAILNANDIDWDEYRVFLESHVENGEINNTPLAVVNYSAIKQDPRFDVILSHLAEADLTRLTSKEAKLAFYINAYNIFAIKMVVDHWPMASIKDAGNFLFPVWKKQVGTLAGRPVTLDEIEHKILRKLDEPRIHFAIVCASVSCPDLLKEPYLAVTLDEQLDRQTQRFLNNRVKGLRVLNDRVEVSKIFDWFEEDFEAVGGVRGFVQRYRPDLAENYSVAATIDYDWAVNGR